MSEGVCVGTKTKDDENTVVDASNKSLNLVAIIASILVIKKMEL